MLNGDICVAETYPCGGARQVTLAQHTLDEMVAQEAKGIRPNDQVTHKS